MGTKSRWPKVTVIISTFERPEMLKRALESVLAQTYTDFEVWVVDDASNTAPDVCKAIGPLFDIKGVTLNCAVLERNSGYQAAPKNYAIQSCRGAFIAYLDDDNEWDPNHLELAMARIEDTDAALVYTRWRYRGDGPTGNRDTSWYQPNDSALAGVLQSPRFNFIDTSAIVHSKAALRNKFRGSVWDETKRRFGDWDLICRCIVSGLMIKDVDAVTFTYWWHGKNLQLVRPADETTTRIEYSEGAEWQGKEALLI